MGSMWSRANAAKKGLFRRGAVVLVAYELVFTAVFWWVARAKPTNSEILWLAALPTLTVAAFIAVFARYLREEVDEFHRELVVRCLLWGLAAVMLLVAFRGLLQVMGWTGHWSAGIDLGAFAAAIGAAKVTYKVANRERAEA